MKQHSNILLILLSVVIAVTGIVVYKNSTPLIGYINSEKLFNSFDLKKQLEVEYKKIESARQSKLDSMKLVIEFISKDNRIINLKNILAYKQEEFNRISDEYLLANQGLADNYNQQIWAQLTQYVDDYRKKHNYIIIIGKENGNEVLSADPSCDITDKLILFVNDKFNGK